MNDFEIFDVEIDKLSPLSSSYRNTTEALNYLVESIKTFGFRPENPLLITKEFKVVQGKLRLEAAKVCKLKTVPCMYCKDGLSHDELVALSIADNKTSEYATWDYEKLKIEIEEISQTDINLNSLGFTITGLEDLLSEEEIEQDFIGETSPDDVPTLEGKIQSKMNTIYSLGDNHRLLVCKANDSRKYKQLLFDGEPKCYLMDFKALQCEDDIGLLFVLGINSLANGSTFYAKINNANYFTYIQLAKSLDVEVSQTLLYNQPNYLDIGDYPEKGIPIIYGYKGKRKWYNDKKQASVIDNSSLVNLWQYFLFNSTSSGDIVFNNLGDTGDIVIASQIINRRSRIVVDSVEKADIIRKRYAKFVYGKNCDWVELTPEFRREK